MSWFLLGLIIGLDWTGSCLLKLLIVRRNLRAVALEHQARIPWRLVSQSNFHRPQRANKPKQRVFFSVSVMSTSTTRVPIITSRTATSPADKTTSRRPQLLDTSTKQQTIAFSTATEEEYPRSQKLKRSINMVRRLNHTTTTTGNGCVAISWLLFAQRHLVCDNISTSSTR